MSLSQHIFPRGTGEVGPRVAQTTSGKSYSYLRRVAQTPLGCQTSDTDRVEPDLARPA